MPSAERTTYRELFRIRSFPRLATGVMLARIANQMLLLTLVLLVLQRFHSPTLAGITVFLSIAPGVALSPVAGALLDRHGRIRLMTLDYLVGFVALALIGVIDISGRLTPIVLHRRRHLTDLPAEQQRSALAASLDRSEASLGSRQRT